MDDPVTHRARPAHYIALIGLLATEIFLLTLGFEAPRVAATSHWLTTLTTHSPTFLRIGVAVVGTLALLLAPRASTAFSLFYPRAWRPSAVWLAIHLLAFAALAHYTSWLFAKLNHAEPAATFVGMWFSLIVLVCVSAALIAASVKTWREFLLRERWALFASVAVGVVAWGAGVVAQRFWQPLAKSTLFLAHQILQAAYPHIEYDAAAGTIGSARLLIEIAPQCSGYEGIALITVFVAVYLWLFRNRIAFPRALWLFPVGIVCIWFANVIRIAALVAIGTSWSPQLAVHGFHSQAGWIAFTAIALALIWTSHRFGLVVREDVGCEPTTHSLASALLIPLIVMLATSMLVAAFSSGFELFYPVSIAATVIALWFFRGSYRALTCRISWLPIAIGTAIFLLWLVLAPNNAQMRDAQLQQLSELPLAIAVAWVLARAIGSAVIVPIAEELAFRGYLLRKLVSVNFEQVAATQFTWLSFVGSSVLFGCMHSSWFAGTLAGAGFALAVYYRGRLSDAVIAHVTANTLIVIAVLGFGRWDLW